MRDQEWGNAGMYQYRYTQYMFRLVLHTIDRWLHFHFYSTIRTYWLAAIVTITVLFWSSEVSVSFERIFIQMHNLLIENGIPSAHKGFVPKY